MFILLGQENKQRAELKEENKKLNGDLVSNIQTIKSLTQQQSALKDHLKGELSQKEQTLADLHTLLTDQNTTIAA